MTVVRLLIYVDTPENMATAMGRSLPDGLREWRGTSSLRIITLKRGGWLRSIWKAWRDQEALPEAPGSPKENEYGEMPIPDPRPARLFGRQKR